MDERERNVLVVGGGIGGITAALEIASCGVNVTMVEAGPSIGGRMIQLDKTFPTLDCSTCVLSPRMVEVALNQKVDLLSWSRVTAVRKEGGGFRATILKKSRYVDLKKCTACGVCSEGCPVVMKNEFNVGTGPRKAVYIPFPQAIPNKALIDKREERLCNMACMDACPVNTNVPGYLKHIAEGRFADAYRLIRTTNPFPSVCGRVCYAPCERACNRGEIDEPLAIRDLKRFAVDSFDIASLEVPQVQKTGKRVAVVGAGPAGLACANDLALEGHHVTVYEALPEPGGMLRYAIPEYRFPKEELKGEIDCIRRLGVEILCGVDVGGQKAAQEIRDACEAVFVATGAPKGLPLGVEGETLGGIVDGIRFLRGVNSGEHASPGDRVAVIGGGNTAVDCARTAKRLGSTSVTVIYRRTREEMPAAGEEIEALLDEGIEIDFLAAPVRFRGEGGKVAEMECVRMELGEPDESGRRRPVPKAGSEFTMPVDSVITALGQAVETSFLESLGVAMGRGGTVRIDPSTGATNIEGVFAGGDVVTGPAYVIDAIAAGRKAARSIGAYFGGEVPAGDEGHGGLQRLSAEQREVVASRIEHRPRIAMPEEPVGDRITDFREVGLGYQPADAMAEAQRCIAGQVEGCIGCGECLKRCEAKAIDYTMRDDLAEMYFDGIVVAPGFDLYDPTEKTEFGYGRLKGVITGMEFERLTSVTGPTGGDIMMNGKVPKRFYFIQCVGSRDRQSGARYCSRVCCMYTAKHACIVKDRIKDAQIYISYIDVRTYGKGYEEFYKSTQENGAVYIRGIPGEVTESKDGLLVRVEDMLSGEVHEIEVDVVVLATGVRPRAGTGELCEMMSLDRDEYGFIRTNVVEPSRTSVDGIFVCGMASGPRDVPDTVASGGEAASRCMEYVKESVSS